MINYIQSMQNMVTDMVRINSDIVRDVAQAQIEFRKAVVPEQATTLMEPIKQIVALPLQVPFDLSRDVFIQATKMGLIESSMISTAKFYNAMNTLEKATLGSLAR